MVRVGLNGGGRGKKVRRREKMEESQAKVSIARYWLHTGVERIIQWPCAWMESGNGALSRGRSVG